MTTLIHQCEKAIFPFKVKSAEWRELCLSVAVDQKVRIVRREPKPDGAAAAVAYHWCVAQTEDGVLGLLPSLVLQHADDESFALSPSVSPVKVPPPAQAPRSRHMSSVNRHVDPFVFDLSSDEEAALASGGNGGCDPSARRTTARPSELPSGQLRDGGSPLVVSPSTSSLSSDDGDNDSVCSFERCPGKRAVQSAPLRIVRKATRITAAAAAASRKKAADAKKKSTVVASSLSKVSDAAVEAKSASRGSKSSRVDELGRLREEWLRVESECVWLQSEVQPAIERAIAAAEAEFALVEQARAKKTAMAEKRHAAAASVAARRRSLREEAQELLQALESGTDTATDATATGRRLFDEVNPNAAAGVGFGDKTVLDLVRQEAETLASYEGQEAKLRTRLDRATTLLTKLRAESELLSVSEDALGAFLMEGVDYEVEAVEDPTTKDAPPVRVVLDDTRSRSIAWPRSLSGLTEEEQAVLENYVRLADKYDAKQRHEAGRFNDLLDVDLETGEALPPSLLRVGGGDDSTPQRVAKLRATVANGDAQVAKLRDDITQLREFVATYEPVAEQIQEQIAIGNRVLKQKEADIRRLQQDTTRSVVL